MFVSSAVNINVFGEKNSARRRPEGYINTAMALIHKSRAARPADKNRCGSVYITQIIINRLNPHGMKIYSFF